MADAHKIQCLRKLAISDARHNHRCHLCHQFDANFPCPVCQVIQYCNVDCYQQDRDQHATVCVPLTPWLRYQMQVTVTAQTQCDWCFIEHGLSLRCTKCKSVKYCGRKCQEYAKNSHARVCFRYELLRKLFTNEENANPVSPVSSVKNASSASSAIRASSARRASSSTKRKNV